MNLTPRSNHVLVRAVRRSPLTPSGLALPLEALTTTQEWVVLAVGPETKEVQVGDRIITTPRPGDVVELNDQRLRIVNEQEHILAVVVT